MGRPPTNSRDATTAKSDPRSAQHGHLGNKPGDFVGPYKLLELIGEGGFGVVWLAERREPFVQRVALKVIKPGMDSRAVIARFDQERQALAVMDHPNVARVLDGGITSADQGSRPYFVMEFVKGESITEYCDRNRLSVRERLELFRPVCDAVQHAHHKGIIHRDIKPTNVLVSVLESRIAAKVIDFGVAKAVSHTLTAHTIFTEHGQLIGTPEYMSPEQAEMGGTDIDTRTDVYSLGVLLYELLTGSLPFEPASLRAAAFDEVRRIIREQEPPKPSTRLTTLDTTRAADVASRRQAHLDDLARVLRRELDWIPLKAMRKDRSRRYPTPGDLSEDIKRYLDGQPIDAAPESRAYLLRKFATRNRGPLAFAAVIVLALGTTVVATAIAARRAQHAAAEAQRQTNLAEDARRSAEEAGQALEREKQKAERLSGLMELLGEAQSEFVAAGSDDDVGFEGYARIKEQLISGALADEPEIELTLLRVLARSNAEINDHDEAVSLLQRASTLANDRFGDHPLSLAILMDLAVAFQTQGDKEQTRETLAARLEMIRRMHPPGHVELAVAMRAHAEVLWEDSAWAEVDRLYAEAVPIFMAHLPDRTEDVRYVIYWQTNGRLRNKRPAADVFETMDKWIEVASTDDPRIVPFLLDFSTYLLAQRDFAGSARVHAQLLDRLRRSDQLASYSGALFQIGLSLQGEARYEEAEPFLTSGAEAILASRATVRAPTDNKKVTAEKVASFYESWAGAQPDPKRAALGAEWRARADALHWPHSEESESAIAGAIAESILPSLTRLNPTEGEVADFLTKARSAREFDPDNLEMMKALGLALYRAGQHEECVAVLQDREVRRKWSGDGPSPLNWAFITMSLSKLGKTAEAEQAFQTYSALIESDQWRNHEDSKWVREELMATLGPHQSPAPAIPLTPK